MAAGTSSAKNFALENVQHAQVLLGPEVWNRIIRIQPDDQRKNGIREIYALVFEYGGILWFYQPTEGTQSLSRQLGDLDHEKENLQPLLCAIDPHYSRFEFVTELNPANTKKIRGSLENGCFIESVAALRSRLMAGEPIQQARLLSYYQDMYGQMVGHTVLTYQTPNGAYVIDPQLGSKPTRIARELSEDAGRVARSLQLPYLLVRARWIDAPVPDTTRMVRGKGGAAGKFQADLVR